MHTKVVEVGGIPRLISLFANSGGSAALTARKNAAICLAKLARNPSYKKVSSAPQVVQEKDDWKCSRVPVFRVILWCDGRGSVSEPILPTKKVN